jgi:hypothetical protein
MANIDRIVSVQISLNTTAIKEQSFSDMLILGPHVLGVGRSMVILQASDLLDLGMSETDPVYLAARDAFSQIPTVNRIFIGRQQVEDVSLTVLEAVEGGVYSGTIGYRDVDGIAQSAPWTVTAIGGDTLTSIAGKIVTAINATAAPVTASNALGVVSIANDTANEAFAVTSAGALLMSQPTSAETPSAALTAVRAETDDFYGVVITSRVLADIMNAAAWVETNKKLQATSTASAADYDPANTTGLLYQLFQNQYFRTAAYYHARAADQYVDAASMAKAFTFYPGAETWALKKLAGVSFDTLSEGQALAIFAKNGNTFERFRNFAVTQNGKVSAGEWIDTIRFRDWLEEQVKVSVVSALINADGKVPYTDEGIQIIVTAMRQALDLGVARGGIAPPEQDPDDDQRTIPSYTVSFPLSANVSFNNKANRLLQDVNFTARLAGAIHVVEIKGSLTYAL